MYIYHPICFYERMYICIDTYMHAEMYTYSFTCLYIDIFKAKYLNWFEYNLPIAGTRSDGFMPFPRFELIT